MNKKKAKLLRDFENDIPRVAASLIAFMTQYTHQ
jgi:hypothetical protein